MATIGALTVAKPIQFRTTEYVLPDVASFAQRRAAASTALTAEWASLALTAMGQTKAHVACAPAWCRPQATENKLSFVYVTHHAKIRASGRSAAGGICARAHAGASPSDGRWRAALSMCAAALRSERAGCEDVPAGDVTTPMWTNVSPQMLLQVNYRIGHPEKLGTRPTGNFSKRLFPL